MLNQPMTPQPETGSEQRAIEERLKLEASARGGASWFIWIAALSMVNTIVIWSGADIVFVFGLGIATLFSAAGRVAGTGGANVVVFVINLILASIFVLLGMQARKRKRWAFYAGITLYGLDSVVTMLSADWLGVAFHAFVLFLVFGGLAATNKLLELERRPSAVSV